MSQFSTALSAALEDTGISQTKFCEMADIGQSPMSRYVRGTTDAGPEVAAKIVRALPSPHNAEVLAAWLNDGVPKGMADLVNVSPNTTPRTNEAADTLPQNLDSEVRKLLIYFARKAVDYPEVRDMLANIRGALEAR